MTIEYSQALDPHSWDTDMDSLRVGDPFTEAWIDRFRALMLAYNAEKAANAVLRGAVATAVEDFEALELVPGMRHRFNLTKALLKRSLKTPHSTGPSE